MISVVVPTHNPKPDPLQHCLRSLAKQSLPKSQFEVILVDNASTHWPEAIVQKYLPTNGRVVKEDTLGLTSARLRGYASAQHSLICFVDDDNVLDADYLQYSIRAFQTTPRLGTIGGKITASFASPCPDYARPFLSLLAIRDHGDAKLIHSSDHLAHPSFLPVGAGMVCSSHALDAYASTLATRTTAISDRRGSILTSGGDCDINLSAISSGYQSGYFPDLLLKHLIPAERLKSEYLCSLAYGTARSWPLVLAMYGICPWKAISSGGARLRKARAFIVTRPWTSTTNRIKWHSQCGQFDGLVDVHAHTKGNSRIATGLRTKSS